MGGVAPLFTMALDGRRSGSLIPSTCLIFYALANALASMPVAAAIGAHPLDGSMPDWRFWRHFRGPAVSYLYPVGSGLVWVCGTSLNWASAAKVHSFAIALAIGQSAPMVAALWGVFYFREFQRAPRVSRALLTLVFPCYVGAIVSIAASSRA